MAVGAPIDGRTEGRQLLAWLYLTATPLALDALRQGRWVAADVSEVPLASCVASALDVAAARSLIVALCGRAKPAELEAALPCVWMGSRNRRWRWCSGCRSGA